MCDNQPESEVLYRKYDLLVKRIFTYDEHDRPDKSFEQNFCS